MRLAGLTLILVIGALLVWAVDAIGGDHVATGQADQLGNAAFGPAFSVQLALPDGSLTGPSPATGPSGTPGVSRAPGTPSTSGTSGGGGASTSPKPTSARPSSSKPGPKPEPRPTTKPPVAIPPASSADVNKLLAQINTLRADNGVAPLTLLAGLAASTHQHNLVMAAGCGLSHQCPHEAAPCDRVTAQGVHWTSCGENIGWSSPQSDPVGVAEGLTTAMYNEKPPNDGHRVNMLNPAFHHIGIDVIRSASGDIYLTQDFSS